MKNSFLILFTLSLFQLSCVGVRKSDLYKQLSDSKLQISNFEKNISDKDLQISSNIILQNQQKSKIDSLSRSLISLKSENESLSKKVSAENSAEAKTKTTKNKEFFENGFLKSESETTESESKILDKKNQEIEQWKYSVNILQEKLYQKQTELFASENSNTRLKQKNSELTKIISDKKSSNSSKDIKKTKETENKKPSFAWFVLAFFIGVAFLPSLKLIFKK